MNNNVIIWSLNHAISSIVWEINILMFADHNKELLQADFNQQSSYIADFLSNSDVGPPKKSSGTVEQGLLRVDVFEFFTNIDFTWSMWQQSRQTQKHLHNHKHLHGCLFKNIFVMVLLKNLDRTSFQEDGQDEPSWLSTFQELL